jgi:hypothetical protein
LLENIDRQCIIDELTFKEYNEITYDCEYCQKKFNTSTSRSRHHKICKKKPLSDIELLKSQVKQLQDELRESKRNEAKVINNTMNIVNNINVNNFGREDTTHLPLEFLTSCFMTKDIPALLENIYFDEEYPQNKTVKLKSLKNKTAMVHNGGNWVVKRVDHVLDEMVNKGQTILKRHYRQNKNDVEKDMEKDDIEDVLEWLQQIWNSNAKVRSAIKQDLLILLQNYREHLV